MNWEKILEAVIMAGGLAAMGQEMVDSMTKVSNNTADDEDKALVKAFYDKINKRRVAQIDADIKKMTAEKHLLQGTIPLIK